MSKTDDLPTIGWVGLGDHGAPIARAIAEAGYPLHVWARGSHSLAALGGVHCVEHATLTDMASAGNIIGLCLGENEDNRRIMIDGGLLAAMRRGSILINHGTGPQALAKEMTRLAEPHGIEVIDAPVSGGRAGAAAKQLTAIVEGNADVVERLRPLFDTFCTEVAYMGQAGAGQVGKLVNNAMLIANLEHLAWG